MLFWNSKAPLTSADVLPCIDTIFIETAMDRLFEMHSFVAVADAGGFSSAARALGASQSTLSKAVSALERRLGVVLLHRTTRHVTLTVSGQEYYDRIKLLILEVDEADSDLTKGAREVSGPIRISTPSTFGRLHILPLLPSLLSLHPGLRIDLILSDSFRNMTEDRIDLAIRVGGVDESDSVVKRVATTPLVCIASRRYLETHGYPKHPSDLTKHNCLIYSGINDSANWPFHGSSGAFSIPVRGSLTSNSMETILTAVSEGVGIGFTAKLSLTEELSHADIVTVLDEFVRDSRDVNIVWPRSRFVPMRVRRVSDFLAASLTSRL